MNPQMTVRSAVRPAGLRSALRVVGAWGVLLVMVGAVTGCGPSEADRVEAIYRLAPTGVNTARAEIVKQWNAKQITLDACLNLAHERLDQQPAPAVAVSFAAAVLGAAADLESAAEKHGVNEFYWFRIGTLAQKAAAAAFNLGDIPAARALVLAGPPRWQGENYWRLHPDHDAFVSLVMHRAGETNAAIARLRGRPDLSELATAVLEQIEAEVRTKQAEAARKKK
jgi:hypothetical protein